MSRLEVCGGIASGKTSLASMLARGTAVVVREDFAANPFWRAFYRYPLRFAFETEVVFLMQHYSALREAAPTTQTAIVADFALLQDLAYADVNLSGGRYAAFAALHKQVVTELGPPDILVHLVCDAEEELRRIVRRDRDAERSIAIDYLRAVNAAIAARVTEVRSTVEVVEIDSARVDFVHDEAVRQNVLAQLTQRSVVRQNKL